MSVKQALWTAVVDFYHQSWRLFVLNAALSVFVVSLLVAGAYVPLLLVLLVLAGPPTAALMHCAVELQRTEDLRLTAAVTGLRLHWRRGLVLASAAGMVVVGAATAIPFYADADGALAWLFTVLAVDVLVVVALLQLPLWPLAVAEHERPLRAVVADAALALVRRPFGWTGLALALLLVNAAGAAAALAPLLTLTIAYSFLAAAHFALPARESLSHVEAPQWQA